MSHADVVPVVAANWSHPQFAAKLDGGYIQAPDDASASPANGEAWDAIARKSLPAIFPAPRSSR